MRMPGFIRGLLLVWPIVMVQGLLCSMPAWAESDDDVLAVIVAPGHHTALTREELVLIYKRKKLYWSDDSKIQPVNLPSADPLRRRFSRTVLGAAPEDMEKYWNDMYFHGVSPPYVLASQEAVIRFVTSTPGAIGYVPYCSVEARARIVLVITADDSISDKIPPLHCSH